MPARVESLRDSTDRSVRLVALGHLADASAAHARLVNETDDEALHDLRVALRRLRSWERAFRPYLKGDVSKKLRRRLRNVARDTGASRDLEVHLGWLTNQRRSLGRRQRTGLNWLVSELEERKADADAVLGKDLHGRLGKLEARLSRALETYRERLHLRRDGRASPLPAFADALAPRVRRAAQELEEHLHLVRSVRDEHEAHEARIAAKRLRYLLEPVMKVVPGVVDLVDRLKALQDVLGDLHDAQVFGVEIAKLAAMDAVAPNADDSTDDVPAPGSAAAPDAPAAAAPAGAAEPAAGLEAPPEAVEALSVAAAEAVDLPSTSPPVAKAGDTSRTPRAAASTMPATHAEIVPGITAIMNRLRDRAAAAFGQFASEWLGDKSAGFFRDVGVVTDRIVEAGRNGLEIERKYLLRFLPEEARDGRRIDIAQGYIPGSRLHERIRRASVHHGSGRKDVRFYRTMKVGEGMTRMEIEEETTEAVFLAMWPLTRRHRLRKRRFEVDVDGRTWEIDDFTNRDLVLAEIELESEDDEVAFPDWLAAAVQREVTGAPEFQNINLAR